MRMIDANWLKENLGKVFHQECDHLYGMMQLIDEAPTLTPPNEAPPCYQPEADVAPVVRGRWLDEDFQENEATVHGFAVCSVCGELSHKAEHGYNILSTYCTNCGAKMNWGRLKRDHI